MNEQAKLVLYRQLEEMSSLNRKQGAEALISEQEFLALTDKDALKYTFEYRDEQTDFGEDIYYIEMPDMNLEGQDLHDVQISRFMLSRTEDGERVPSNINLRNTGITINLTDIGISEQTQDDIGLATQTIDFSNVAFHGCELYGILNDEYQEQTTSKDKNKFVVLGRENLDERYVQRRQEHHLTPEQKKISDRAYERLISGKSLSGMRGVNEHIDLTDYDLSLIKNIDLLVEANANYNINMSYNGIEETVLNDKTINLMEKTIIAMRKKDHYTYYGYSKDDYKFAERYQYLISKIVGENILPNKNIIEFFKQDILIKRSNKIKEAYENGNMEFVERHWESLSGDSRDSIIKAEYENGNMDLVERHWDSLNWDLRDSIIKAEYENGNMEFVERYWDSLSGDLRDGIIKAEYEKGDMDFVMQHWDRIAWSTKSQLVNLAYENGNMEFVEQHWYNGNYEVIEKIVMSEYKKGDMTFLERHWETIDSGIIDEIVMLEYKKGDMKSVERYWADITREMKGQIIRLAYENGNIEFIEQHWLELASNLKSQIVRLAYENGNMEFVSKHLNALNRDSYQQIIKAEYENGNIEFIEQRWASIDRVLQGMIVESEYQKGNMEFVEQHWNDLPSNTKKEIAICECKKGNYQYIKQFLEEESKQCETHGRNTVSRSGAMLSSELSKAEIDKDLILGLIQAGSGLEYESYQNLDRRTPERTPTLYKALKIENEQTRREVVTAMLKAGVNPTTMYVKQKYSYDSDYPETIRERCLDVNGGELRQIMQELGMEVPGESPRTVSSRERFARREQPARDNKVLVSDFLTHEVGLSAEQISSLEQSYQAIGRDVYSLSTERLGMQKEILDYCGGTKQVFTKDTKVLAQDPQLMYARLMLYRELGVAILPDRLYTTIGISKKGFAKNFGAHILEKGNMEDGDYEYKLKQELLKRYPMPQTREELKRALEELRKQEIGG